MIVARNNYHSIYHNYHSLCVLKIAGLLYNLTKYMT